MNETNILTEQAYSNESLKRKQIYKFLTEVNKEKGSALQCYSNPKKGNALRMSSPLSPPLLKRTTAKLSEDLRRYMAKAMAQSGEFSTRA
jgi:hypothetical protein